MLREEEIKKISVKQTKQGTVKITAEIDLNGETMTLDVEYTKSLFVEVIFHDVLEELKAKFGR